MPSIVGEAVRRPMPLGRSITGDVIRTLRYHGVLALLLRVLIKALSPVGTLQFMVLCEKDLSQPIPDPQPRLDVDITQATEAEIDNLLSLLHQDTDTVDPVERLRALDRFLQDFRDGSLCFVAKHGRMWVHSNWIRFPGSSVQSAPGRFLRLQPDEAYMTDGFTPRLWRGMGIHPAVNCAMLRFLQTHGYRKAYTQVALQNISSRKGLARVGWHPAGIMRAFTALGRRGWICRVRGRLEPWVDERPSATPAPTPSFPVTGRPRGPAPARPAHPVPAGPVARAARAVPRRGASARPSGPRILATWAGLVGLILAGCSDGGRVQPTAALGEWVYVGTNPFAAAQPTPEGRRLHTLQGWGNELYMGYGDYEENTGPIEISVYHPGLSSFTSKLRFATEAVEIYRPIGDRLYAPAIDPVGSGQSASVAVGEPDGRWWNNKNVFVTHAFDIATLDGSDLWLVGSRGARAVAAHSTDGGRSWTTALTVSPVNDRDDDFARFYFVFTQGGRLYVQAEDAIGGPHPRSRVRSGARWTDGPDLKAIVRTGCKPLAFAGHVVYRGGSGLMAFDGVSARRIGSPAMDLVVDSGTLYVLDPSRVRRTTDLFTWTEVATPPAGAISIGVLEGRLYAGTAHARLYRFSRPMEPGPSRPSTARGGAPSP